MRVSDPPPPPGHGVLDSHFKFRSVFAKSWNSKLKILRLKFLIRIWRTRRGLQPLLTSPLAPRIPPGRAILGVLVPPCWFFSGLFRIWGRFFLFPKTLKKHLLPERPKISKTLFGGDYWSHCGCFLDPLWRFFAGKINAKTGNGKDQENHQKSCFVEE